MEKEFIPYSEALALKELGFDEPCMFTHTNNLIQYCPHHLSNTNLKPFKENPISAPLYQQAFRWFREKYNLNGLVNHYPNIKQWDCSVHNLGWSGKELVEYLRKEDRSIKYDTYEEAELECLKKLIEIVKK